MFIKTAFTKKGYLTFETASFVFYIESKALLSGGNLKYKNSIRASE
jgi:hypothetical protein